MGIKANTGLATIEVNEKGDKISFFLSDNEFIKKFFDFVEWFQKSCEEISQTNKSYTEDDFLAIFNKQKELSDTAIEMLEKIFGEGTCEKIFGQMSPVYICVVDVVAQLSEEVSKLVEAHNNDFVGKYSRDRKGARSK